ncbi:MAG: class I SAM-dependent methyltransferase [Anaerolineales bacterium]
MTLSPQDWHLRYSQQARWTHDMRTYLFGRAEIDKAQRLLEVGCGTGAILSDLPAQVPLQVGVDIDISSLQLAIRNTPKSRLTQGDGHQLPFPDKCFDITLCHFLLLWVDDPGQVLREMVRVTHSGGAVLALAEPDYGGRIDYPDELSILGEWQKQSLRQQWADPMMGRKLAGLFHRAGLEAVETGVLGGQWSGAPDWEAWEAEWRVLESDLAKTFQDQESWQALKNLDYSAQQNAERVLFVPTFYAWGSVP